MSETPGDVSGARRMSSGNFPERQGSTLGARALLGSNAQTRRGSHLSAATPLPFGRAAASLAVALPLDATELRLMAAPPGVNEGELNVQVAAAQRPPLSAATPQTQTLRQVSRVALSWVHASCPSI